MRRFILLYIITCFFVPFSTHAEEMNAGFVQGLWYSSPTIFANTPVRMYVALRNNTNSDLSATVRFTVNGKRIGSSDVNALSGRLVEAWADWTPTFGEHKIVATLSDANLHVIGDGTQPVDITGIVAEDTIIVDYDTDGDGIGNEIDTDDDNDGISDVDEKARGSNPLVPNPQPEEQTESEIKPEEPKKDTDKLPQTSNVDNERGLEKYVGEGITNALLTNVTERVDRAKQSLDTYREERNNEFVDNVPSVTSTETLPGIDNATITRSKIETKGNFLRSFISGVASLLHSMWTFVLWTLSKALAHPALIQVFLLIGILYTFYRVARRIGSRPR